MLATRKYNILQVIIVGLLILNFTTSRSALVGGFLLTGFFIITSLQYAHLFGNTECPILFGALMLFSLIIILTSVFYFIYALQAKTLILALVLLLLPGFIFRTPNDFQVSNRLSSYLMYKKIIYLIPLYCFALTGIFMLFSARTSDAIVSPWAVIPQTFFIFLFLLIFFSIIVAAKTQSVLAFMPIFLLAPAIALIIYNIGYGFDQFVHTSALRYIALHGEITPKTPYYIGQYGLEIFLNKFSGISLALIQKALLPLFFGILFLGTTAKVFKKQNIVSFLSLLLLPLTSYIATTPQGLANLFLILTILTCFAYSEKMIRIALPLCLAISTAVIHPIAGIPALLFLGITVINERVSFKTGLQKTILWVGIGVACAALPLIFFILSRLNPALVALRGVSLDFSQFKNLFDFHARYNFWLDLIYISGLARVILLGGFIVIAFKKLYIEKKIKNALPHLTLSGALIFNFIILTLFFSFPGLIFYEQGDFARRFLDLSIYFLIPLIIIGADSCAHLIGQARCTTKVAAICVISFFILGSIYLSYPRKDAYDVSHGFSTSIHDIHAVQEIDKRAGGKSYVVLANQALGAAALHEFGFLKPYIKTKNGEIYFYSIPTGGELYKYYLQMIYEKPRQEIALHAADLTGVERVFLVVNSYWYNAKKIIEEAKQTSSEWFSVDNGAVYIFKY